MSDPYSSGSSQNNRGQNQGENPWPVYGQTNPGGVQEGQGSTPWPVYGGADASGSQPPQSPQYFPGGQAGAQFPTSYNRRRTHMGRPRMELVPRAALHMVQEFHKTPPGRTRADTAIRCRLRSRHEQDLY